MVEPKSTALTNLAMSQRKMARDGIEPSLGEHESHELPLLYHAEGKGGRGKKVRKGGTRKTGFEPATSSVTGRRSNQLSYFPKG
jgi:hypothetical protein